MKAKIKTSKSMRSHSQNVGVDEHTKELCETCGNGFTPVDKLNYHCQVCQPCKAL